MNLITLENISKSYSEKKLLENISLGINDKEKIGLIGVKGTGKSTLLKIIAGAEMEDSGTITKANKVRIEYLPQNPYYDENATVLEQVFKGTCEEMKIIGDYVEYVVRYSVSPKYARYVHSSIWKHILIAHQKGEITLYNKEYVPKKTKRTTKK